MIAMTCHLPSRGWGASRGSNPSPRDTHTHVEFPVHSDEWRWLYFDSSDSARENRKLHVYNVNDQVWNWDQGLEPTTSELIFSLPSPLVPHCSYDTCHDASIYTNIKSEEEGGNPRRGSTPPSPHCPQRENTGSLYQQWRALCFVASVCSPGSSQTTRACHTCKSKESKIKINIQSTKS